MWHLSLILPAPAISIRMVASIGRSIQYEKRHHLSINGAERTINEHFWRDTSHARRYIVARTTGIFFIARQDGHRRPAEMPSADALIADDDDIKVS